MGFLSSQASPRVGGEDPMMMVQQANEAGAISLLVVRCETLNFAAPEGLISSALPGSQLREEEVREDITWSTFWWWVRTAGWR